MSVKRRNTSSPECEGPSKRQRSEPVTDLSASDDPYVDDDEDIHVHERPQVNTSTGQSGAFPGLGSDEGEDVFYGPANDGLDYLRMVRSEAKGIPQLLVARADANHNPAKQFDEAEEEEEEDQGGYWDDDGTYTARADLPTTASESKLPMAQLYYYDTLLAHFNVIRATMKCIPPLSAIENLTSLQPISFPPESKKARSIWKECLLKREPSPVQIACMDTNSVFQLVRLLNMQLRVILGTNDVDVVRRFGSWVWAVLGKCPSQGVLMSEDISELRQLAQKAVEIANRIGQQYERARPLLEEEFADEDDAQPGNAKDEDDLSIDIAAAKRRLEEKSSAGLELTSQSLGNAEPPQTEARTGDELSSRQNSQAVKIEKMAILDMILSVIGEVYGQRDLLELRKPWRSR